MTLGGIAVGLLAAVASTSNETALSWHRSWFLSLVSLSGFCVLVGFYIVLAGAVFRLPPRGWTRPVPRIDFGTPYRAAPRTYDLRYPDGRVTHGAPAFSPIALPITARDANIANCRASVEFEAPWASFRLIVKGRWENRAQPMQGFGQDWSTFDKITFLKDENEDVGIAVQHDGDPAAYALCNRLWEMPLHHNRLNFQHPEFVLPVDDVQVTVTVRGEDLRDSSYTFAIRPINGEWLPHAASK
jgi:hypothetical protein